MRSIRDSSIFKYNQRTSERKSVVGSFSPFSLDIYRERIWKPHEEMEKCIKMYDGNTYVQSAVNTMKEFIKGGEIRVKSKDPITRTRAQAYIDSLEVNEWIDEIIENCIKTGNSYAEVDWLDAEWKIPYKIYPLADSSRIYINCDQYGEPLIIEKTFYDPVTKQPMIKKMLNEEEYYIQRINDDVRNPNARYYTLSYDIGSHFKSERIYGIPINKRKLIHFRLNMGNTGVYGRPYIASALDDNEMLKQIERSIAIIAKYKAVPRDIITYGDKENPATDDEVDEFILYLESLEKDESAIVNKPVSRQSLSYAGQDINLDYAIQHISKKLIAGIAPDFMMGLGQDINKATAQISLISYILAIYSKRHLFLKPLEKYILKPFLTREKLHPATLEFGELDFETKSEKTNRVGSLWTMNLVTFNEAREELGKPEIGDKGNKYYMEWQKELGGDTFGFPNFGSLPNGESQDKVFTHNEPDNKLNVQKGGKLPFDTEQQPTNIPKTLPKKDLEKPGTDFNKETIKKEASEINEEMKKLDEKIMQIINSKDKTFNDKKEEINGMKSDIEKLEDEISEYDKILLVNNDDELDNIKKKINPKPNSEKIHIIIEDDKKETSDKKVEYNYKQIDYKTLVSNFGNIFREPRTTEVYYKEVDNTFTVSFVKNGVLIYCVITQDDILSDGLISPRDTSNMTSEEKNGLINSWKNKYLYKAIKEV